MSPWIRLLRPKQWIKNGFVFAGLFFSGEFTDLGSWWHTALAALSFLLASSVVYIANDLYDREEDRKHPHKSQRPLASGAIGAMPATLVACGLAAITLYLLTSLPLNCTLVVGVYAALNVVYTLVAKRLAIVDIFLIASFYVLRVLMGCYALMITISPWIILSTFLLALFLGFCKRYHEMGFENYVQSKPNLQHYSRELLDRLVIISSASALITYAIYAVEIAERAGRVGMVYTVGFVAFGLFRYLQSVYVYKQGGEPETIILRDAWQLANLALWLFSTLYFLF